MKLLVTGATGFIGSELLFDEYMTEKYDIIPCNKIDDIPKIMHMSPNTTLLHLAGLFSGSHDELWNSNVELTKRILDLYHKGGGSCVIYLSTGAVYGNDVSLSGSVETDVINPPTYYGFTKQVAELLIQKHWGGDKRYQILRLPNVYGASQKKGVVYNFAKQIRETKTITIEGDGEQRRDFLHISDLLHAIDCAIEYKAASEIFNISSGLTLTINKLAELLINGREVKVVNVPDNNGLRALVLDISKAKKYLGYAPKVNKLKVGA